ncbi:MAG: biopolymer transporter ExbD [Thermodesulfobacteriota bacterium]|nr:biopolymer transporter ExbD [Thermodesulfobacteriota bacterium]
MIQMRRRTTGASETVELNIGPLIDLIFLLLIFFIVSTSFVKETGVDVHRPVAKTAERKEKSTILVGITEEGGVYMENRAIDVRAVRANVEKSLADNPEASVIVLADEKSLTGTVIKVVDQCRLAGAKSVSIAAELM